MSLGLSQAVRNARALVIRDAIDAGPGNGRLTIYAGPRPTTGGATTGQAVLAELVFAKPCATLSATGVLQFAPVTDDLNANNSGTAEWCRITDSQGVFVMDGSVGLAGATLNLNDVNVTAGRKVRVVSFVTAEGNA